MFLQFACSEMFLGTKSQHEHKQRNGVKKLLQKTKGSNFFTGPRPLVAAGGNILPAGSLKSHLN